ncbi:MAG: hypothetical protein LBQ46_07060 [Treponema sp.]|jgi:hypothetical protein|nr:hypothetical protein [Treponema sp.]
MRPVEHFLSQIDKLERGGSSPTAQERIARTFVDLTAPVIGRDAARDLCGAFLDRGGGSAYQKLGCAAAFLLGEFDETMDLDPGEWEDIRASLEDAAGEMDLNILTALMGELLARGKI